MLLQTVPPMQLPPVAHPTVCQKYHHLPAGNDCLPGSMSISPLYALSVMAFFVIGNYSFISDTPCMYPFTLKQDGSCIAAKKEIATLLFIGVMNAIMEYGIALS